MRQTGYEQDWINAMNAAGNLANTLRGIQSAGLVDEARRKELEDRKALDDAQSFYTKELGTGVPVEKLQTVERIPTKDTAPMLAEINRGLAPSSPDYVKPEAFSSSSDLVNPSMRGDISPAVAAQGLKAAMDTHIANKKNATELVKQTYAKKYAAMTPEVLAKVDPSTEGENALPAFQALSEYTASLNNNAALKNVMAKHKKELADRGFAEWDSAVKMAELAYSKGDTDIADQVVEDAINTKNNSAYFVRKIAPGVFTKVVRLDGVEHPSREHFTTKELISEMRNISKTQYTEYYINNYDLTTQTNHKHIQDPTILKNRKTGDIISVAQQNEPGNSSEESYLVFGKEGKRPSVSNLEALYSQGYQPEKTYTDIEHRARENEGLKLRNTGIDLDNKAKALQNKYLSEGLGKNGKEKNIDVAGEKYKMDLVTDAFVNAASEIGVDLIKDPNTGRVTTDSKKPIALENRDALNSLAAKYGLKAYSKTNPDSIDVAWSLFDDDGYDVVGVSPVGLVRGGSVPDVKKAQALEAKLNGKNVKPTKGSRPSPLTTLSNAHRLLQAAQGLYRGR